MLARFGNFLIFIGILLFLLFVYTDAAGSPYFRYLLLSLPLTLAGMALHWTGPRPERRESNRFRILKKRAEKRSEKQNDE